MKVQYHPEALSEIQKVLQHYSKEDLELAVSFLDLLDSVIRRIERHPELYRMFEELYRKCHLKRFPYSVVYWVDPETDSILIVAVAHDSRQPNYWRDRF